MSSSFFVCAVFCLFEFLFYFFESQSRYVPQAHMKLVVQIVWLKPAAPAQLTQYLLRDAVTVDNMLLKLWKY